MNKEAGEEDALVDQKIQEILQNGKSNNSIQATSNIWAQYL